MTSSISGSAMNMQRMSPLAMLQKNLVSEISSGKINSADQDALSAALQSIDDSMQAGRSSGSTRKAPPSPDEAKAKVESLIDDQVTAGKLTSEQADELKQLFADTFDGGPGGAKGAGGPPPPPPGPPPGEEDSDESGSASLTISGSSGSIAKLLQELIEKFAQTSSSTSYGTNGRTSTSTQSSSLFLDISV